MNQGYRWFTACLFVIVFFISGKTQTELGTYFLDGTWGARELNLTDSLRGKIEIYLPGIYLESHHSNQISLSDITTENSGSTFISLSSVIDQLEDSNTFENNFKFNTIGVGIKLKNFDLDFRHNTRLNSTIGYPKELAKLLFEGNSQFIGETVEFGPSVDYFAYHEYGFGLSRTFGNFALGARIKYLSGIGFVRTDQNQASLFTDDDVFQLTFNTDYVIQTSNTIDISGFSDFTFQADLVNQFLSNNNGWAFDLGASYQVSNKLSISASILDAGAITWNKDDSRTFTSNGNFTYEGFDINAILLEEDTEFEIKLDTLEEVFGFVESSSENETELTSKLYIAGQYQILEKVSLGALLYANGLDFEDLSYGVNLQYSFGKLAMLGLNYGYRKDSFSNLGFQFISRLGPIVIFGSTDNIISLILNNNYRLNGRIGLGLSF